MVFRLDEKKESPHFIVRYNLRNPRKGKGHGAGGVENEVLVDIYSAALERLYDVMSAPPWSRPAPLVGSEGKTIVNLINTSEIFPDRDGAFTTVDDRGIPYVCLPCGNDEPTRQGERHRAMSEAVHEAAHVFNCRERHLSDPNTGPWGWMHEAMAVYMETVVLKGNDDSHRFLRNWVVTPETSLDAWHARYQAGRFLCYVSDKMGPEIVNNIWTTASPKENPLQSIVRVLGQEKALAFSSASPDVDDAFGSGYCLDSYFLQDGANAGHAKNVFQRHGARGVAETLCLSLGESETTEDRLDHLACRYYRFFLESQVSKLEVQLQTDRGPRGSILKAEIAAVTKDMRRGPVFRLSPSRVPVGTPGSIQLSSEIPQIVHDDIDHFVLVVSNCGFRAEQPDPSIEHDDRRQYTITATGR